MSEKTRQNEKIASFPISTIFLLVVAPIKVVTMIIFISSLTLLFSRTDHPPPQKKKSPKRGAERSDFRWTSQEYISPFIQSTDTSLHPHNTSPLPFQMNTRTNVFRSSLMLSTPTINALFVTFSEKIKIHFFKWIFLGGPGRYKFKTTCNVLTIYMENNLRQRLNWSWNFKFLTVRCL